MPDQPLVKPPDCTCQYPLLIARNMCGHVPGCPVYERWRHEMDLRRRHGPDDERQRRKHGG